MDFHNEFFFFSFQDFFFRPCRTRLEANLVNLLGNGEIKRREIKVKNIEEMGGFFKVWAKYSLWSPNFSNCKYQVTSIYKISEKKINFDLKLYFYYFQIPSLIQERESSHSSGKERISLLTSIPVIKIVDLDVNMFNSMMKVPLKYFFFHYKTT